VKGRDTARFEVEIEADKERKLAALMAEEQQTAELVRIEEDRKTQLLAIKDQFRVDSDNVDTSRLAYAEQMNSMVNIAMVGTAEAMLGQFASVAEGATTAQKVAFLAQKALAVAQIIMYTELAAAQAMAIPGDTTKAIGMALATKIRIMGYGSAGLTAALAVGEMAGGSSKSNSGAYDDGGFIPYNSYGIVGEYGPEIVHGPANVTSREKSAKQLGNNGSSYDITLAPVIKVTPATATQGGTEEADARALGQMVQGIVVATMKDQTRPNGMLDNWLRANR
jgi:hypothetical protein